MPSIYPATANDLPQLRELYLCAMRDLHRQGISQWNDEYPVMMLPEDIARGELYLIRNDNGPVAAIGMNNRTESWHVGLPWTNAEAYGVHRLVVHPAQQGKGYARALMDWAHQTARERGGEWMHLDTHRDNARAMRFYARLGYAFVADIGEFGGVYSCFEKDLRTPTSCPQA